MDIRRIADAIAANKDIPRYARMVSLNEIVGNDYNLNIPRYIDNRPPENLQNIDGHLHGGVRPPTLNHWQTNSLFLRVCKGGLLNHCERDITRHLHLLRTFPQQWCRIRISRSLANK